MPNNVQNIGFSDYSAEQADIDRRRKLAEALQAQGMSNQGGTEMAGGWAIPKSPLNVVGQLAQSLSGAYQNKQLNEREKALSNKYQTSLSDTLSRAMQAGAGTPAKQGETTYQGMTGSLDEQDIPRTPDTPAIAPDRARQAQILMTHPATQQIGMQQAMQDANTQRLIQAFGVGGGNASPQGANAPTGQPSGNPAVAQATSLGIPQNVAMGLLLTDPTGKSLAEEIAKSNAAMQKPTRFTAGGGLALPNGQVVLSAPQNNGIVTNYGPKGPTQANVPGSLEANAAVTTTQGGAKQPFQTGTTKVPVYLPGGDQVTVELNPVQMQQYNQTGKLPPEIASSIPGLQQGASQQTPQAAPQLGQPPQIGSVATTPGMQAAVSGLPVNPAGEPPMGASPQNLDANGQLIAPRGRPVVGRTQSQNEGITQQRQTSGGKTTDETYAKDYVSFVNGGAQDAEKQLSQLQDVITQLSDPAAKLTGPVIGSTPDALLKFSKTGQNAIAMRERVEEVVQRSLRAILGAQFTEKEGERLIARAYNPNLPEKENALRVGRLFTQLQQSLDAKRSAAEYFQKNNTLQGWQGKLPSMGDFEPAPTKTQIIPGQGMSANNDRRSEPRVSGQRIVVDY